MRIILFIVVLLGFAPHLQAQKISQWLKKQLVEKPRARNAANAEKYETYRVSGLELGNAVVQDTRMAPNIYSGTSIGAQLAWAEFSDKWYHELRMATRYASPTFQESQGSGYTYLHATFNYSMLKKTQLLQNHLYLGLSLEALDELRQYAYIGNSSLNNDLAISINPMLLYQNSVQILKRENWFYTKFSVNAFSFVNRFPSYNFNLNGSNSYWAPIGQFNRLRTEIGTSYKLKWSSENRFGISYSWDFHALNEMDKLFKIRSAQHSITFNWWFKTR